MLPSALPNAIMHAVIHHERSTRISTRGRKKKLSATCVLDRIFYVCKTGYRWNQLEVVQGSWKTVFHYFNLWSKLRLFENAFYNMSKNVQSSTVVVETSFVKNVCGRDVVGRYPTDRGRKATKVSFITNEHGTPLTTCFHKANKKDCSCLRHIMDTCARKTNALQSATALLADIGYITCRSFCKVNSLADLIPKCCTKGTYVGRYVVEQTFGILDKYRRIRVRYESTIKNFKSFHYLACACIVCNRLL